MRRSLIAVIVGICALGFVTFAVAQDATPSATPDTGACASPAASPAAGTPVPAASPSASPTPCTTAPAAITIEMVDIAFRQKTFTVPAGVATDITIVNKGLALHDFSIDELNISVNLAPGESTVISINAPAGKYTFYCNIPGHKEAGMLGQMTAE